MRHGHPRAELGRRAVLGAVATGVAGCAIGERGAPVPDADVRAATVLGLPNERFCVADPVDLPRIVEEFNQAGRRQRRYFGLGPRDPLPPSSIIAFGGGENGAFGAGLACGWTEAGTRPRFNVVTGISTGALTAPLVFAGPQRDGELRAAYTSLGGADDVLINRGLLAALLDDALADSAPLARSIAHYMNGDLLAEIAAGYRAGRQLIIATTNLDAQRPVGWNIGAIAESGDPRALDLVRRVLLASAAVPGLFPPVMIDVTVNGRPHQEMHVDGGTFAQAYLYPPALGESRAQRIREGLTPPSVTAYVVRNGRLTTTGGPVRRRALDIAGRAISTLIGAAGLGNIYRIPDLAAARRHRLQPRAYRGRLHRRGSRTLRPGLSARALFDYAHAKARVGYPWKQGAAAVTAGGGRDIRSLTLAAPCWRHGPCR